MQLVQIIIRTRHTAAAPSAGSRRPAAAAGRNIGSGVPRLRPKLAATRPARHSAPSTWPRCSGNAVLRFCGSNCRTRQGCLRLRHEHPEPCAQCSFTRRPPPRRAARPCGQRRASAALPQQVLSHGSSYGEIRDLRGGDARPAPETQRTATQAWGRASAPRRTRGAPQRRGCAGRIDSDARLCRRACGGAAGGLAQPRQPAGRHAVAAARLR
eukprot:82381-Chlamydomonas_euryale.AAC.4